MSRHAYSSTLLATASKHCPRAMAYQEDGEPYDRRPFEVGIAAHAILEAVGRTVDADGDALSMESVESIARETGETLIAKGRSYNNRPEPPLRPESVWEGRDLALDWLAREPMVPGGRFELGIAVDRHWKPTGYYDDAVWLRAVVDVVRVGVREDEESSVRFVTVRDYKSSWAAGESELQTIQRKVQAVLAWIHFGADAQAIRLEVVNLRTLKLHAVEYWPRDGDVTLTEWRADLEATLRAYDSQRGLAGGLPAIPGGGCYGCPFALRCPSFRAFALQACIPESAEDRARLFVAAEALRDALREGLKADSHLAPIFVPGGVVGTVGTESRVLTPEAYLQLWSEWSQRGGDPLGFAKALELTTGNAEALAKVLYPTRKELEPRRMLLDEVTTTEVKRRFGFHADAEEEETDAARS